MNPKKRLPYKYEEDIKILNYIISKNKFLYVSGNELWKEMHFKKVTNHSAQSMRTHFFKIIVKDFSKYSLNESDVQKLLSNIKDYNLSYVDDKKDNIFKEESSEDSDVNLNWEINRFFQRLAKSRNGQESSQGPSNIPLDIDSAPSSNKTSDELLEGMNTRHGSRRASATLIKNRNVYGTSPTKAACTKNQLTSSVPDITVDSQGNVCNIITDIEMPRFKKNFKFFPPPRTEQNFRACYDWDKPYGLKIGNEISDSYLDTVIRENRLSESLDESADGDSNLLQTTLTASAPLVEDIMPLIQAPDKHLVDSNITRNEGPRVNLESNSSTIETANHSLSQIARICPGNDILKNTQTNIDSKKVKRVELKEMLLSMLEEFQKENDVTIEDLPVDQAEENMPETSIDGAEGNQSLVSSPCSSSDFHTPTALAPSCHPGQKMYNQHYVKVKKDKTSRKNCQSKVETHDTLKDCDGNNFSIALNENIKREKYLILEKFCRSNQISNKDLLNYLTCYAFYDS